MSRILLFKLQKRHHIVYDFFLKTISTFYCSLLAYIKMVNLGKNCIFWGRTIFEKSTPSQIISIGNNCHFKSVTSSNLIGINRPCILSTQGSNPHATLKIGNNCSFSGVVIGCFDKITIGDNGRFGANVTITDSDWHLNDPRVNQSQPIIIEDNVWIGMNTVILKGVHVGRNALIAANSVVTSNIPPNVIAAGNPCKTIKFLDSDNSI